jgi:peptidoglycan/xylan/chitin deacetylase (PgdA/CDA1 family)
MILVLILVAVVLVVALVYWVFMSSYSQVFGTFPWRVKTSKKVIALTFDDGPNEPYTSEILNYLNSKGVKATFFQVGKCVERYPDTTKEIIKSGHVIGNHSLSHAFHNYLTHPAFENEIDSNQQILKNTIGKSSALFRSPWLWRQPWLLKSLRRRGLQPVSGQFCHPLEPFQIDGDKIARSVLRKSKPGAIIIFHDGRESRGGDRSQTVKATKIVVDQLLNDGYQFVTIDELLGVQAYQ